MNESFQSCAEKAKLGKMRIAPILRKKSQSSEKSEPLKSCAENPKLKKMRIAEKTSGIRIKFYA